MQAVTKRLVLLEEARPVVAVRKGREKLRYLNPVPLHEIHERWIVTFERHRLRRPHSLNQILEQENGGNDK